MIFVRLVRNSSKFLHPPHSVHDGGGAGAGRRSAFKMRFFNLDDCLDKAGLSGDLVETDGSSTVPPSVHRILNFKSCRGAIMFGDPLLPSECSLIVEELKATSLCFQCAHGRPTTVPLLNIASLHELLAKLEKQKGGPMESWHGLCRNSPSIQRAKLRLDSAKRFCNG